MRRKSEEALADFGDSEDDGAEAPEEAQIKKCGTQDVKLRRCALFAMGSLAATQYGLLPWDCSFVRLGLRCPTESGTSI